MKKGLPQPPRSPRKPPGAPQQEGAKARAVPEYGDLRPAKYVTDEFKPAFPFEVVDEGWVVAALRSVASWT